MAMKKGIKELVAEAEARIKAVSVEEADRLLDGDDAVFVDVRDVRELERDGMIPGAVHAPRGMLEFWVDPESPYHKDVFAQDKTYIFYCALDWRSALATARMEEMGLPGVCHLRGGFTAWKEAGRPVAERKKKA